MKYIYVTFMSIDFFFHSNKKKTKISILSPSTSLSLLHPPKNTLKEDLQFFENFWDRFTHLLYTHTIAKNKHCFAKSCNSAGCPSMLKFLIVNVHYIWQGECSWWSCRIRSKLIHSTKGHSHDSRGRSYYLFPRKTTSIRLLVRPSDLPPQKLT